MQDAGHHTERDDEQALREGEAAEERVTGQPARRLPAGP